MFDFLIRNGQIIDGTGNPGFYGSIGITEDRLSILRGDVSNIAAKRVIDGTGRVISPGFIDIHTHSALMLLANPLHEPKVFQGVTTEVIGVDGMGYAPVTSPIELRKHICLNAAADGAPKLIQNWLTVGEYLSCFDQRVSCNVAYLIGNGCIRTATVGWEDKRASPRQLDQMKCLLRHGMEEGAFGVSTGLDYPPGSYANSDEIIELCKEANNLGGFYHTHVRYTLGDRFLDPYREAIEIGFRSGIPVHLTHVYQRLPIQGGHHEILNLIETARRGGLDVTFDGQPYPFGSTLLLTLIPQHVWSGGPEAILSSLSSSKGRKLIEKDVALPLGDFSEWWLTGFKQQKNKHFEGKSIEYAVEHSGKGLVDTICDLLVEENLGISAVLHGFNASTQPIFLQHPLSMVGSDSLLLGDYVNPRTYGTFPYILANLVREEKFMRLPEAIRKMTSACAERLGLKNRGLLKDGFKADIVVFDPLAIRALATRIQPRQFPQGIDFVIVNGKVIVERGKHTGALPGHALRRGQD